MSHQTVVGNHNRIYGHSNSVTGNHNTVEGNANSLTGNHNSVTGDNNRATGNHNGLHGAGNTATGNFNRINGAEQERPKGRGGSSMSIIGGGTVISGVIGQSIVMDDEGVRVDGVLIKKSRNAAVPAADEVRYVRCPTEAEAKTHDKEAPDDAAVACSICTVNELSCIVLPCAHRCLCCGCARTLTAEGTKERGSVACPICQAQVKKIKVVY